MWVPANAVNESEWKEWRDLYVVNVNVSEHALLWDISMYRGMKLLTGLQWELPRTPILDMIHTHMQIRLKHTRRFFFSFLF